MELLYHATTIDRLSSILKKGLLTSKSTGARKVVWCCKQSKVHWATTHTAMRHRTPINHIVVIVFRAPRKDLKRHGNGLWYSTASIPPERIEEVLTFALVAK